MSEEEYNKLIDDCEYVAHMVEDVDSYTYQFMYQKDADVVRELIALVKELKQYKENNENNEFKLKMNKSSKNSRI